MAIKFLGTTDDVTTCECCGRVDLKSTVGLSIDGGDPVYYGVTCAARALSCTARYVRSSTAAADRAREAEAARERRRAQEAATKPWFDFLRANGKGDDTFRQIESLGGYTAARALFNATKGALHP
ncbi:MAG: hypothetical protein ACHREM_00990 [Polyangiales bacterium]